ncbi:uncharacterized protein SAPINGB_P000041 [Magnusiomyces paraingens]|uniref:Conserved oligomeric Golgi complex subunit 6 n=1 Tax=Magnusiomyces paraingens TaxID=2606893 RepID=A0A5E8AY83_9ASCO|nr:uncharacterized protein SAPINGB_P000041 [Saprochaete ingens]VVT43559.1 unnamed protein product [Saprochaete ingens]
MASLDASFISGTDDLTNTTASLSITPESTPLARPDNAFSQKIASILSTSYTDPSVRQAITSLDSRVRENTGYARRHLRYNTEAEIIAANGLALKDYSKLINKLETIGSTITQLTQSFNDMQTKTTVANSTTDVLLTEAKKLIDQRDSIKVKQVLLDAFKAKFVVSEPEIQILTQSSHPINDDFFSALQRVRKTHSDCQALLSTEDDEQMGLDIMQKMTQYLDKAYDRLFFTVQRDLKVAVSGSKYYGLYKDEMTMRKQLSQSLAVLSERPNLFQSALQSLAESRNKALSTKFVDALTTDTRVEKAIDFYAYDSLRYLGDMLAYVHAEIVNERETLTSLFEYSYQYHKQHEKLQDTDPDLEAIALEGLIDPEETVNQLLDKITSSMIKPLKTRVESVIASETRIPLVYKLIDKLRFYETMYNKAFFAKNNSDPMTATTSCNTPEIMRALEGLVQHGWRQFSKCLEEVIDDIKDRLLVGSPDLQSPEFLSEAMGSLKEVLQAYEASMVTGTGVIVISGDKTNGKEGQEEEENNIVDPGNIQKIIQDMTEPFLECCNRIASDLPDNESELFTINCLDAVKMVLQFYDTICLVKIKQLDGRIEEISDVLVERQHRKFLEESGLQPLMSKVHEYYELTTTRLKQQQEKNEEDSKQLISRIAELKVAMQDGPLSKEKLAELSFGLDNFLPSATMESLSFLFRLASPRLAQNITMRASQKFAADFSELERLVLDIYSVEDSKIYFPRTYKDVCVLLAIVDDTMSIRSVR